MEDIIKEKIQEDIGKEVIVIKVQVRIYISSRIDKESKTETKDTIKTIKDKGKGKAATNHRMSKLKETIQVARNTKINGQTTTLDTKINTETKTTIQTNATTRKSERKNNNEYGYSSKSKQGL